MKSQAVRVTNLSVVACDAWPRTHTYCSRISHQYILFNHSDTPNTESREVAGEDEVITVAKRDIQLGEELTDDYRTFEAHFVDL
jgi:SET domain-containing protein